MRTHCSREGLSADRNRDSNLAPGGSPKSNTRSGDNILVWAAGLVFAITFLVFLPVLKGGFVSWDDQQNFVNNLAFRGLRPANLRWMWTTFHMGHYAPLSWMTLGLDYVLWGMNPTGYHLTSLILHCANAVLVLAISSELFTRFGTQRGKPASNRARHAASVIAALFFAINPLRVESVAWVTERRDVLSLFFYLIAILSYLRYARPSVTRRDRWYVTAVLSGLCAMLSKGTAVTLPVTLLILNLYPLRRVGTGGRWRSGDGRRALFEIVPFCFMAFATTFFAVAALHPEGRVQLTLGSKAAVSAYSLVFYLWKTLVPVRLSPLYPMPAAVNPVAGRFIVAYVLTAVIFLVAVACRKRWPAVLTAWAAFIAISLPTIGVIQNGPQIAADRYTYHSAPALAVFVGCAVLALARGYWSVTLGAVGATLVAFSAATWRQAEVWQTSETLWSRVLEVEPRSAIAEYGIGQVRVQEGRINEGIEHYRRAISIDSSYAEVYNDLGLALAGTAHLDDASAAYARAVRIHPSFAEAHNNWGVALARKGDIDNAAKEFQRALSINPSFADAEFNWGYSLLQFERLSGAIDHLRRSAELQPNDAETFFNWGLALAHGGSVAQAVAKFRRALVLDPSNDEARAYLRKSLEFLAQQDSTPRRAALRQE